MPLKSNRDERSNEVVIKDGSVLIRETRVLKAMPVSEFMTNLKNKMDLETPILPPNTVYFKNAVIDGGAFSLIIVEVPPNIYRLNFGIHEGWLRHTESEKHSASHLFRDYEFKVAMPYTYVWITIHDHQSIGEAGVFVTKKPLESVDDKVGFSMLGNLHNSAMNGGSIPYFCLGDTKTKIIANGKIRPWRPIIKEFLNSLMTTKYNTDLDISPVAEMRGWIEEDLFFVQNQPHPFKNAYKVKNNAFLLYDMWEKQSINDFVALSWTYRYMGTFGEVVDSLSEGSYIVNSRSNERLTNNTPHEEVQWI